MNRLEKAHIFRDRFFGRQDVFANIYYNKEGRKSASPACSRFYKEDCPLRDPSSGITCTTCSVKNYINVSDETVLKHIEGYEEHAFYVLQKDGTINFAAFDFDCKDIAKSGDFDTYSFKDVQRATSILKEWGLPYLIARSTTFGYHVYMFFEEPLNAGRFRGLIQVLLDKAGFLNEFQEYGRPQFEIFPKQISVHGTGLGNPIKPPMIECRFLNITDQSEGRNCLVDDNDVMIPAQYQWATLKDCPKISLKQFDDICKKEDSEDWVAVGSVKQGEVVNSSGKKFGNRSVNTEKRNSLIHGSVEKVIEGCAAFRELLRKVREDGHNPKHEEGFALYHMCINIVDGEKWFDNNIPTWGKTVKDKRQLLQSNEKGYAPWSCKKMQAMGVCNVPGKKCFDKKPAVEIIEGREVILPESQWPEPSPVRYALSKGEDFLLKLINESTEVSKHESLEYKNDEINKIIKRSGVFDDEQRKLLQSHIETLKIKKKSEISKIFHSTAEERQKVEQDATRVFSGSFSIADEDFILTPTGYALVKHGKRGAPSIHVPISNFFIDILEERSVISEENNLNTKKFFGKVTSYPNPNDPHVYDFEISTDDWFDTGAFFKFFGKRCGADFNPRKMDIDLIRQASTYTAQTGRMPDVAPVKKVVHYTSIGWHNKSFYMPSVVIDNSGIRVNDERPVRLPEGLFTSSYDFKILSEAEISSTLHIILNDMLNMLSDNGRGAVMMGLGFTFMTSIHRYIKMKGRPTIWFNGLTGAGKTQLTILLQRFYGANFNEGFNWKTTYLSILGYAHDGRDCLFLMDDYKGEDKEKTSCLEILQHGYDGSFRGALNKDGTQKKVKVSRGLFMMSGEEYPDKHASAAARTVIVNMEKLDTSKTFEKYEKCVDASVNFCGITPLFIHHAITTISQEDIVSRMRTVEFGLVNNGSEQNIRRIAHNLAFVKIGWELFIEMCRDRGLLTQTKTVQLEQECHAFIEVVKQELVVRCNELQAVNLFLSRLRELIISGSVVIDGLDLASGFSQRESIGFMKQNDVNQNTVYILPNKAVEVVRKNSLGSPIIITTASIGNQLKQGEYLTRTGQNGDVQISVRNNHNMTTRVWAVNMQKLGVATKPKLVNFHEDDIDTSLLDSEGVY